MGSDGFIDGLLDQYALPRIDEVAAQTAVTLPYRLGSGLSDCLEKLVALDTLQELMGSRVGAAPQLQQFGHEAAAELALPEVLFQENSVVLTRQLPVDITLGLLVGQMMIRPLASSLQKRRQTDACSGCDQAQIFQ
jgi:hypothetical protein